jgi:hypothetical protein
MACRQQNQNQREFQKPKNQWAKFPIEKKY